MELPSNVQKIAFLADYVPRQCGIATFTADLYRAIVAEYPALQSWIVAMTDCPEGYNYPSEVRFEIHEQDISAYRRAADFLNLANVDVLCLQHEFGIFGGPYPDLAAKPADAGGDHPAYDSAGAHARTEGRL